MLKRIKYFFKSLMTPPFSSSGFNSRIIGAPAFIMWEGPFAAWEEAAIKCTGYDTEEIIQKCKQSLLKVKNGEVVYERDSVLFDKLQYNWPLLSCLLTVCIQNKRKLSVLDFGGSFGTVYYQNKSWLNQIEELKWVIVEQAKFVEQGRLHFANDKLQFAYTLQEAQLDSNPSVILLSGVLQYLSNPTEWIHQIMDLDTEFIILDRTGFVDAERDIVMIQNVPSSIYEASYPVWFFNEKLLLNLFFSKYSLVAEFDSFCDVSTHSNSGFNLYWKGFFLRKNK